MEAEQILKRIGYDNNSITATEMWIAKEVYRLAMEDAAALRQPLVSGSVCKHCGCERDKHTVLGMCLDRVKHFEAKLPLTVLG